MDWINTTAKALATMAGAFLAVCIADATIETTGATGAHASLIYAMCLGVIVGAAVIGHAFAEKRRVLAVFLAFSLFSGEVANFLATGDRLVTASEGKAAPLVAASVKRKEALERLHGLEGATPAKSARTVLAEASVKAAKADVAAEASNVACKKECIRKQGLADSAAAELRAALAEDAAAHASALNEARAEVEANPAPASATPLADRVGWAPWALDLLQAGAMSLALNGLAGGLIAFGTHGLATISKKEKVAEPAKRPIIIAAPAAANDRHPTVRPVAELSDNAGQSDFPELDDRSATVIRGLFGNLPEFPDSSPNGPKPGRKASPRKGDVLADIVRRIENGERFESQDSLRAVLGEQFGPISKSTLSDWLGELESEHLIPNRRTVGRCKALAS